MAAQQMQQLSPSEQGVLLGIMVGQGPEQEQLPLEVKWVVVPPAVGEAAGAAPSVVRQLHAILDSELAVSHVPSFLATSTEGAPCQHLTTLKLLPDTSQMMAMHEC
jgi:hypothetical protein